MPCQLLELFQDETMSFIGIGVGGDISKIGRDFHCIATMKNTKRVVNLGKFARVRNVVKTVLCHYKSLLELC